MNVENNYWVKRPSQDQVRIGGTGGRGGGCGRGFRATGKPEGPDRRQEGGWEDEPGGEGQMTRNRGEERS